MDLDPRVIAVAAIVGLGIYGGSKAVHVVKKDVVVPVIHVFHHPKPQPKP